MGSPLTELMCTNCGAIVKQIDKKMFKCTGCGTLFVLDQDARGDDFLYQKIEVEKIEGGKISSISTEVPTKQIVAREVKLADNFELEVSKDSLLLSKKESVDAVRAFITNNDYVKALEEINRNLSLDNSIGELYFYKILARKHIPQIEKIFGLPFTVEDRNDLETCFENSSPQFISAQLKKLFSNVVVDDQSTRLLLESSIPYSMSEQVLGLKETSRLLEKPFDLVIDKSYRSSFEYLLRSLNNSDVKKYIDYNVRFAKKCPDPAVAKKAIQNVLKVDIGNPEALFSLVTIDLSFEGFCLEETTKDFKQFIEYSSNSDKDIIKVLDHVKSIHPDKLTHKISEFIKKVVGYYSLGFEKLNNYLLDFAYAFLKAGYLQKQDVLFKDAENFLHLCLSIDKNDFRIYWGLCLFAVRAYDDTSAINSQIILKNTPVFTKYIAITSDTPEQKHAFDVSNKQEQRMTLDLKRAKAKKRLKKIFIAVGAGITAEIIAIVVAAVSVNAAEKRERAASNFVLSVTSKENDYKDSMYYDGYVIAFHVSLNNKSSLNISELLGDMRISLNSPNYTWEYNTSLYDYNGGIKAKSVSNFVLTIDERESDKTLALYNASISKLQIEYKLTKITFDTYETQTYSESYQVIKPYGSYGGDTSGEEQEKINEQKYQQATSLFNQGKYEEALAIFETISFYKDSSTYITNCRNAINEQKYQHALSLMDSGNYDEAIAEFESIVDYKDSQSQIYECKYKKAKSLYNSNNLIDSYNLFLEISSYKDSSTYIATIQNDADAVAQGYALAGNYQQAIDLLKGVGETKTTSDLYAACSDAIGGNYRSIVALLNPSKVIVVSGLKALPSQAFYNCENVTEIVLPNTLTTVGSYAFSGCSSLTKINMPDSITTIGEKAFRSCTSLTSFTIPSSLESLGGSILTGCSSLSTITTKLSNKYFIASFFISTPSYVTGTPSWPSTLSKIVVTSGNTIPKGFFSYLPSTVTNIQFAENIVEVGENAFAGADVGLILPTTVKTIGSYAYSSLGYLGDEITLHEGLETIGAWAFQSTTFKTINLPGTLTSIGSAVFGSYGGNNTLKKINFNGTKAKWLSIIHSEWSYGMGQYYEVECTDAIYHHSLYDSETGWTDK